MTQITKLPNPTTPVKPLSPVISPPTAPLITPATPVTAAPTLGGGDQKKMDLGALGSCSENFCFVDMNDAPTRSLAELHKAAQTAQSPMELQDLADEVQGRLGVDDLPVADAQMVLDEIILNKAVSPHTLAEITQFAIEGLASKSSQISSANLLSTVMQASVASPKAYGAIAKLNPTHYPPTVAPYLRQPVQQAAEKLKALNTH